MLRKFLRTQNPVFKCFGIWICLGFRIQDLEPDIAILDISMPGRSGIEVIKEIRKKGLNTKVILLTMHDNPVMVEQCIKAGVDGYILKDNAFEDLLYAIRTITAGGNFISPSITKVVCDMLSFDQEAQKALTHRENQVLQLIAQRLTNKEIANQLTISLKTVETHRARIIQKLNLHTTADLTRYAVKRGLVK